MDDRPCTLPWHHEARRLWAEGVHSYREIARRVGRDPSTVNRFFNPYASARADAYSLDWQNKKYRKSAAYRNRKKGQATARRLRRQVERAAADPVYAARRERWLLGRARNAARLDRVEQLV